MTEPYITVSAAERLAAIENGHESHRILPIGRKTNTKLAGFEAWTRARDIEEVMDALPQIVAVVEAAAELADAAGCWNLEVGWDVCSRGDRGICSSCATRFALAALKEKLS